MELCARASIKAATRLSVLFGFLWKAQLFLSKTKELLYVQTQQAVASHSTELYWNHSNTPEKKHCHSLSHTHTNCLPVCFLFTHAHKQTGSQILKGQKAAQLHSAKALDWTARRKKNWAEKKQESVTQGSKTFPLLWTWLTLWGHWQSTLSGERELCWQISHWHAPHLVLNSNSLALSPWYLNILGRRKQTYLLHPPSFWA